MSFLLGIVISSNSLVGHFMQPWRYTCRNKNPSKSIGNSRNDDTNECLENSAVDQK